MKTDLWWAAPSLDSWDWIKRKQPAEHSHAFIVLFWLIGCHVTSSFGTPASVTSLLPWTPTWNCGPRKSFLPELLLTGHFIIAAEKKTKTAFLLLPRFSYTLSSAAAKQNSVTTDKKKKPSGSLPQSSRHRPSMVFLYVAVPTSSSAMSILVPLVFYLFRMALGLSSHCSEALHA